MGRRKGSVDAGPPGKNPVTVTRGKPTAGKTKSVRPFDIWLDQGLHKMFDSVAQEPVPEELLRLLEEDRKK